MGDQGHQHITPSALPTSVALTPWVYIFLYSVDTGLGSCPNTQRG